MLTPLAAGRKKSDAISQLLLLLLLLLLSLCGRAAVRFETARGWLRGGSKWPSAALRTFMQVFMQVHANHTHTVSYVMARLPGRNGALASVLCLCDL